MASKSLQPAKPRTRWDMKSASANWSSGTIVSAPAELYERSTQVVAWSSPPDPSAVSSADALAEHAATDTTIASRARARRMFMGGSGVRLLGLAGDVQGEQPKGVAEPRHDEGEEQRATDRRGRDRERLDEAEG